MTGLDLATSVAKGALSLVLLAASGYAQTYKEATMASQPRLHLTHLPLAKQTTAHSKWRRIAAAIVMDESTVMAEAAMPTVPRPFPDPCRLCHMQVLAVRGHTAKAG